MQSSPLWAHTFAITIANVHDDIGRAKALYQFLQA
jgi:hypothetical protein